MRLLVNGTWREVDVEPDTPLLWVLRDSIGLNGTKFGCGVGYCGACTVHIDGQARTSCDLKVGDIGAKAVTTIEGLSADGSHPVQKAWVEHRVPQCGYCQPGFIMAAAALVESRKPVDDAAIDKITNICRCGTYGRIRDAIKAAANG